MSLRLRLAALFTLTVLVLMGIGGYVYVKQLRFRLETSLDQGLQARANTIAATVSGDPSLRLPSEEGGYAQLFSGGGTVLHTSSTLVGDRLLSKGQVRRAAAGHEIHADRMVNIRSLEDPGPEEMRVYGVRTGSAGTVVAVAARRDLVDEAVQQATHQLVILGGIVLILIGPGSWLLARAALRPVDRMRAQVASLSPADRGETAVPVPHSRDELSRLARTFNSLLARLHAALERERSFVADAGHELRTPLTVLKGEFELAQRPGRSREDLLETIDIAAEETERLIRLTENLLLLAREERPAAQVPIDLHDLARKAAAVAGAAAAGRAIELRVRDDDAGVVLGDPDQLRQALDNLLTNALRHAPTGGTVTIRLAREAGNAVVEVSDDGPGFPTSFLPVAFERFKRADDARSRLHGGDGLGLAIVAAIMGAHGGTASAANPPTGGAVVTLRWPQPASWGDSLAEPADSQPVAATPHTR